MYHYNGNKYLRLVQSVRVVNKLGYKVSQKKVIKNIGPLVKFDDGEPNYVERLKKSFKSGNPIIPELLSYCIDNKNSETYKFSINEGSPDCFGHPKLFSYVLVERIMEELGLNFFFSAYKGFSKIKYDVYGFAKLLIFGRLLNPASKRATVLQNDDYYEPILKNFNPDNVYDTLSFISQNKDKIIRRINTNLVKKAGRSPNIIYYDVTNFYFEIDSPDSNILDDNENVVKKGQRKFGVCKEERHQPIVQMGLFMDDDGIPIAIETFPGNTLDHQTFIPSLKKSIDNLEYSRFIMIADKGICNYHNLLHLLDCGNGYVISKSLLKSSRAEQQWVYQNDDYIVINENFKYKSRIVKRKVKDSNGNIRILEEKIVVYWSKKFWEAGIKGNKKFLDFLKKLQEKPANFRITALQVRALRKFMKKNYVNKKTGEEINLSDLIGYIDFDKVKEYQNSFGYYQIVTSEINMSAQTVIDKYHGLTQIEDQFRVMKGDLETRPFYVRIQEHIDAHLIVCMISLIITRIIQKKIKDTRSDTIKDASWSVGMSCERIKAALNKWKVDKMPGDLYRFMDIDDPDLSEILNAFGINIYPKLYKCAELKSIKTKTTIFI